MPDEAPPVQRWRRLFVEGFVIVASILLAFGIDAWWDLRNERGQAQALIAALVEDFETARERFDVSARRDSVVLAATERLLLLADLGPVPESEWAAVDSTFSLVFYSIDTFDPPLGAVETILSSGRLDLFEDEQLLPELTRWTSDIAKRKSFEEQALRHFFDRVIPFLAGRLELRDLDKSIPWQVPWVHRLTPSATLLENEEFRSIIYMHWVLHLNIVDDLPNIDETITRITELALRERDR